MGRVVLDEKLRRGGVCSSGGCDVDVVASICRSSSSINKRREENFKGDSNEACQFLKVCQKTTWSSSHH